MDINNKIYKYITIISFTIVFVLVCNLIIPLCSIANSENSFFMEKIIYNETNNTLKQVGNTPVGYDNYTLYWAKGELTIVKPSQDATNEEKLEYINNIINWFKLNPINENSTVELTSNIIDSTINISEAGKYYTLCVANSEELGITINYNEILISEKVVKEEISNIKVKNSFFGIQKQETVQNENSEYEEIEDDKTEYEEIEETKNEGSGELKQDVIEEPKDDKEEYEEIEEPEDDKEEYEEIEEPEDEGSEELKQDVIEEPKDDKLEYEEIEEIEEPKNEQINGTKPEETETPKKEEEQPKQENIEQPKQEETQIQNNEKNEETKTQQDNTVKNNAENIFDNKNLELNYNKELPQAGSNNQFIIVMIILFGAIGTMSLLKYKKIK